MTCSTGPGQIRKANGRKLMHDTPAAQLSTNYSFRYNGKALRVYRGDIMEQVKFAEGGEFSWSDDGKGYTLTLKEIRTGEPLETEVDITPVPHDRWGLFTLDVHDTGTGADAQSEIEIRR